LINTVAKLSYFYAFAAIWPHAYFQQLAETHSNGNTNSFNTGPTEFEGEDEGHGGIALRDGSRILDSMESGRRS
jgi:diacylglycerol diphosphate phosphatase / phosphatidate phosphatase